VWEINLETLPETKLTANKSHLKPWMGTGPEDLDFQGVNSLFVLGRVNLEPPKKVWIIRNKDKTYGTNRMMVLLVCASDKLFFFGMYANELVSCWWRPLFVKILAAHRQGYRVTTLHIEKWLGNPIPLSRSPLFMPWGLLRRQFGHI